jgi:hypothetical protein
MLVRVGASRWIASTRLAVPTALKVSGLAVLFAAGVLLSIGAGAQTTETTTATTTTVETTTAPGTTVVTTVEQTTTRRIVPTGITTSASSSSNETPTWVWVLLGILAVAVIALVALLARRGGGGGGVPAEERVRRRDAAVGSWTAQGWALESQSADSAVLLRGSERLLVSIDQAGRVSTQPLPSR